MNQEQAERIAAAIDARAEELTIEEMAKQEAGMKATGKLGGLVAFGLLSMVSGAGLTVIGLLLFAAVRGIGRWLEVW